VVKELVARELKLVGLFGEWRRWSEEDLQRSCRVQIGQTELLDGRKGVVERLLYRDDLDQ
jgi:hypothetical protein